MGFSRSLLTGKSKSARATTPNGLIGCRPSSLIVMTFSLGRGIERRTNELGLESDMIPLDQLQPWINVAAPAEFVLFLP